MSQMCLCAEGPGEEVYGAEVVVMDCIVAGVVYDISWIWVLLS
jgi:hypothetical protein